MPDISHLRAERMNRRPSANRSERVNRRIAAICAAGIGSSKPFRTRATDTGAVLLAEFMLALYASNSCQPK